MKKLSQLILESKSVSMISNCFYIYFNSLPKTFFSLKITLVITGTIKYLSNFFYQKNIFYLIY